MTATSARSPARRSVSSRMLRATRESATRTNGSAQSAQTCIAATRRTRGTACAFSFIRGMAARPILQVRLHHLGHAGAAGGRRHSRHPRIREPRRSGATSQRRRLCHPSPSSSPKMLVETCSSPSLRGAQRHARVRASTHAHSHAQRKFSLDSLGRGVVRRSSTISTTPASSLPH